MATISVTGHGSAAGRPDEVVVMLEIAAVRDTATDALADVSKRSAVLERIFDELDIAEEARSTTGVSVQEHHEYEREGQPRVRQRASNRLSLRLRDAELLPRLLRAAVERAQAQVQGPWWQLGRDNPARLEACRLAAADARRRAEAYAEALGLGLGALESAAERDSGVLPPRPVATLGFTLAAEAGPPVHPGELEATAAVEVTYALADS